MYAYDTGMHEAVHLPNIKLEEVRDCADEVRDFLDAKRLIVACGGEGEITQVVKGGYISSIQCMWRNFKNRRRVIN